MPTEAQPKKPETVQVAVSKEIAEQLSSRFGNEGGVEKLMQSWSESEKKITEAGQQNAALRKALDTAAISKDTHAKESEAGKKEDDSQVLKAGLNELYKKLEKARYDEDVETASSLQAKIDDVREEILRRKVSSEAEVKISQSRKEYEKNVFLDKWTDKFYGEFPELDDEAFQPQFVLAQKQVAAEINEELRAKGEDPTTKPYEFLYEQTQRVGKRMKELLARTNEKWSKVSSGKGGLPHVETPGASRGGTDKTGQTDVQKAVSEMYPEG